VSSIALGYRPLLVVAVAASIAACAPAYRTGLLRKDVLADSQQVIADTKINHGDMTISGSVDRADTTYDPGQPITLSVQTSKDAYVAILRVLPNGDTAIILPNRAHSSAAIAANTALTVPAPGEAVKIAVDKPGIVLFEFIASTASGSWLFKRPPDNDSDFADLGGTTRTIAKDLVSTLKPGPGHDTAATYLTVRITGRSIF
jgi:hypothetical protein